MSFDDTLRELQKSENIVFSAISGFNFYRLAENQKLGETTHALHAQSEALVYLMPAGTSEKVFGEKDISWFTEFVLKPMPTKYFEWPVDLVQVKNGAEYILYYVFPQRVFLDFKPIRNLLYQKQDNKILDWRNKIICDVCRSFLTAMDALAKSNYSYLDFNMDRIVYQEKTGQILLRHTLQVRQAGSRRAKDKVDPEKIAIEFAPPYLYKEDVFKGFLPAEADYYSIAAILFRLMIGRLPYEGKGLANHGTVLNPLRDRDEASHINYFRHYHDFPNFIFSKKDESNHLAPMLENDLPRERWEMLPEKIKEMFYASLDSRVAEGKTQKGLYTPMEWLTALNECCWDTEDYRR